MHENERSDLQLKFINAYAVSKRLRPFSGYVWLNNLDSLKGLIHKQTYNNESIVPIFLKYIADNITEETLDIIDGALFFSITMDGSTDASAKEQETLFI